VTARLRSAGLVALACSLLACPVRAAAAGPISGIFSNVQQSPATGDLGGLEIEFHSETANPYVLVVFCEGWCNRYYRAPVRLDDDRFDFAFDEQLLDERGVPVATDRYEVSGRLAGSTLMVDLRLNANRWNVSLTRVESRFGLAVAHPDPTISKADSGQGR
jgi:hypothetical protein